MPDPDQTCSVHPHSKCPIQSAYRKYHFLERVILKITNDMFEAIVLFYLLAAFDTINHSVLDSSTLSVSLVQLLVGSAFIAMTVTTR